jgi:hypothetical protein
MRHAVAGNRTAVRHPLRHAPIPLRRHRLDPSTITIIRLSWKSELLSRYCFEGQLCQLAESLFR